MLIELDKIILPDWDVEDRIDGVVYRWATEDELSSIKEFVSSITPSFTDYYDSSKKILIGLKDDELVASAIINFSEPTGIVGCIVVKKESFGNRVGANIVALGNKLLKRAGISNSHIGYTDSMDD